MDAVIGVVIGFILGAAREGIAWIWRRHEATDERRATVRETARLVAADLADAQRILDAYEQGDVRPTELGFGVADWLDRQRQVLVGGLDREQFAAVNQAYGELGLINGWTADRSNPNTVALDRHLPQANTVLRDAQRALTQAAQ